MKFISPNRIRILMVFAMVSAAIFFLVGCADNGMVPSPSVDKQSGQMSQNKGEDLKNSGLQGSAGSQSSTETMKVTVYHATQDALYLVPEVHVVPKNEQLAQTALELLLAGTTNKELVAVLPQGTKLRGLTIKNHIAYADFTDPLVKNNGGGSATEMLIVGAIVNTLTEFPDVHKVQILVDGKKIDTLSGHMDTSQPLSRLERLIKKNN